ncbi:MAG: metal-dependent hydrolase [Pseudomonadales bacterium]
MVYHLAVLRIKVETMDPLTQGVLGAALPQATVANKKQLAVAGTMGLLAGMAPDLDVLIRSSTDPLLFLEYHRQFTHSLFFIPFGALICAAVLWQLFGRRWGLNFKQAYIYCFLGYATHGLLDSCTTYGTQLLWPFSDARIAWNNLPIIDPLYTLPILGLVVAAGWKQRVLFARLALAWILIYPLIGVVQRDRATAVGWEIASSRGHQPIQLEAKPSFANLLVWKTVYETEDRYYVDAVRVGTTSKIYPGESVEKLVLARDLPWLLPESQQAKDIERFRWFSNGYIAKDPDNHYKVIDIRYSLIPNEIKALWSLEVSPLAGIKDHALYTTTRDASGDAASALKQMVFD